MDKMMLYLPLVLAILGLIFMIAKASWVNKQTTGNERMQSILPRNSRKFLHLKTARGPKSFRAKRNCPDSLTRAANGLSGKTGFAAKPWSKMLATRLSGPANSAPPATRNNYFALAIIFPIFLQAVFNCARILIHPENSRSRRR